MVIGIISLAGAVFVFRSAFVCVLLLLHDECMSKSK